MLVKPPLERLLPKVENRYTLAILVAYELIAKRKRRMGAEASPIEAEAVETDA